VRQEKEATVGKKHCMSGMKGVPSVVGFPHCAGSGEGEGFLHCMSGMVVNKRQCHRISVVVFCIDFK